MNKVFKALVVVNLVLCVALLIGGIIYIASSNKKLVYVDNGVILSQTTIAKTANSEIEAKAAEFQNEILAMEKSITNLNEIVQGSPANQELKAKLNEQIEEYKEYVMNSEKELEEFKSEKLGPVLTEINNKLGEFGKKYKYYIVFGATAGGNIVYADKAANVTDDFIKFMEQGK